MDEIIRQAIAGRRVVAFRYRGRRRVGEPHVLGTKDGRAQLLVYQTGGSSTIGSFPSWRRCDLDEVSHLTVTGRTFQGAHVNADSARDDWDEIWAIVR
jgi:hypothetical protein